MSQRKILGKEPFQHGHEDKVHIVYLIFLKFYQIVCCKLSFVLRRKYRKNIIKSFDGGRQEPSGISCWTDSICKSYTLQAKLSLN